MFTEGSSKSRFSVLHPASWLVEEDVGKQGLLQKNRFSFSTVVDCTKWWGDFDKPLGALLHPTEGRKEVYTGAVPLRNRPSVCCERLGIKTHCKNNANVTVVLGLGHELCSISPQIHSQFRHHTYRQSSSCPFRVPPQILITCPRRRPTETWSTCVPLPAPLAGAPRSAPSTLTAKVPSCSVRVPSLCSGILPYPSLFPFSTYISALFPLGIICSLFGI